VSKRLGKHERRERDFYPTPYKAVLFLLPHLAAGATFYECCSGDGRLIDHLALHGFRCTGASDIRPIRGDIHAKDALDLTELDCEGADLIITNPPHDRPLMHALIDHLRQLRPTWLLLPADWIFTRQAGPYLAFCKVVVPIGRMKSSKVRGRTASTITAGHASNRCRPTIRGSPTGPETRGG
jgi:hypothetical protein